MPNASFVVHCISLLTFTLLGVASTHSRCDMKRSRTSRDIVHEFILVHLQKRGLSPPKNCFFNPSLDKLAAQERNKFAASKGYWKCGYCGKVFKGENFIDQHLATQHDNEAPLEGICLADFCDILHCDYFSSHWSGEVMTHRDPLPCRNTQIQHSKQKCMAAAAECLMTPSGQKTASYDWFVSHFCGALTCNAKDAHFLLKQVTKLHRRKKYMWTIFAAVVFFFLLLFYAGLWMYFNATEGYHSAADLHPLKRKQRSFWSRLFGKAKRM